MSTSPVTLDMSTSVPVSQPQVTLDLSTSVPLNQGSAEDQASQTRQMLVSGLTGMPTPNMTAADRASFERGKAAGAVSVPLVAGATVGATAAPEVGVSLDKVVKIAKALGYGSFGLKEARDLYKSIWGDK